jgi:eukaryotic-like serine/threonine-protein kinase
MNTNPGRIDKYELQELLDQDGMTEVWKAFDTQARRYVAIKFLHVNLQMDPGFVTRFQRETLAIAALNHPNIVQYYDFSILQPTEAGNATAYMIMKYVDGGTLADYIRNTSHQGRYPAAADIIRLFTLIGTAVEYAHRHGIVHSQLKPTNILLDKHNTSHIIVGEPIVTNFGILKLLGVVAGNTGGWQIGTPLYTSPEQIMGSPGDERSDIYSLGIMLYEICSGTPPFLGNNPAPIMMQHINTIPTLPALINPGLPAALTTIIMRCIAKDPWARFPTVSSLLEALAQAVGSEGKEPSNISLPVNVGQPDYSNKDMDLPTVITGQPPLPAGMIPAAFTPSSPGISGAMFSPLPTSAATPESAGQAAAHDYIRPFPKVAGSSQPYPAVQPGGPITPMLPTSLPGQPAHSFPTTSYVQPPENSPSRKPRRRTLRIALVALLILVLVGSGLGAYYTFFLKSASPTVTTGLIAGHAYFVSSGLLSANSESNQGITDQLQIKLENIPPPPSGKNYYAWLLNDKTLEWKPIPLGQLTVNNDVIDFAFPGDQQHSDLLATNSRFLITEEDAGSSPVNPSLNSGTLLYYAEFSQTPDPTNPKHYSLYDHVRHLLANDPKVKAAGLTGGLDIWLYRNTQKILEWAGSARDSQKSGNVDFIHRQLTRIIDYLDGTYYNQHDLPGQPLLVDPTIAKIGLLTFDTALQVNNPGYLYHIGTHLRDLAVLPQANAQQKALAIQISQAINGVNAWFQTIRSDVLQLYQMPVAQLLGSEGRTLLDTVATLANTAFVGQINSQGQVIDGVVQIHYAIQRLATFDVRGCTASNPCPSLV